jgi:hypothetical protein
VTVVACYNVAHMHTTRFTVPNDPPSFELRIGSSRYKLAAQSNARYTYYYFTAPILPQVGPVAFRLPRRLFPNYKEITPAFPKFPRSRLTYTEVQMAASVSDIR